MRGDWTDWWNFGSGSTAHETAQLLEGQRHLDQAMGLRAWHPTEEAMRPRLLDQARRSLALYAEHTWGADRSISRPGSPETRTQLLLKLGLAPEGASLARMFRRDGLERLARHAGGEEPRLLVYNPHPFPVRRALRLPYPAASRRCAGAALGHGDRDVHPDGPELASHPATGRGDGRHAGRPRLLERADRCAGALLRHDSGDRRTDRRRDADGERNNALQREAHRHVRSEGGRGVVEARWRRVRWSGARWPSVRRAGARATRGWHPRGDLRARRPQFARLAQGMAYRLEGDPRGGKPH